MSKLAHLIAEEEGYGIPGSLPTRNNNPGDLRHSPHSFHKPGEPNSIGKIDTPEDGWADLERQLRLFAERGMTLKEAIYTFAPPTENNTGGYLNYVMGGLGVSNPDIPMSDALLIT
jgi:hypothetical protein